MSGSHSHLLHGDDSTYEFLSPLDRQKERRTLLILIWLNIFGMLVEVVGGLMTHSLALLSDAGHMFTHLFSIVVAYLAIVIAGKTRSPNMSFGYFRMEILAAFFNGATVLSIVVLIVIEAMRKLIQNPVIMVREMFAVAVFGLIINLVGAALLHGKAKKDINLRAVVIHLLSDTFSSVAIIVSGIVIFYTKWYFVDALASLIIAGIIGYWGVDLLRSSSKVLLQAVPESINPEEVIGAIRKVARVKDVHDVHIWELTSEKYVMTGHILTDNLSLSEVKGILAQVNQVVRERFSIGHTTFQFECEGSDGH